MPLIKLPGGGTAVIREYLIVSGITLANSAFFGTDLSDLRRPADQRGRDRVIPHGSVLAKPRRRTASKRSLPMVIFGNIDQAGNPLSDYQAGMDAHLAYLNTNVVAPISTGDGTRSASLVLANSTRNANIHVEGLEIGRRVGPTAWVTLHISIPGGEFF